MTFSHRTILLYVISCISVVPSEDQCSPNPCQAGGACTCISTEGSCTEYTCQCPECYQGDHCELATNACDSAPCLNGGTCFKSNDKCDQYSCRCPDCYTGIHCQINACYSAPCLNGGTCFLSNDKCNQYSCRCRDCYTGIHCQISLCEEHEFVFTIPVLVDTSGWPHVLITTSSRDTVYTTISIPGIGFEYMNTVTKNNHLDIALPQNASLNRGDAKQNKTIIVRASNMVSVYGIEDDFFQSDGFLVIPSLQLGTQYYAASYTPSRTLNPSFICVSALNDITSVYIKTKAGQEHQLMLEPYESYRYDGNDYEDLSGTLVQTDEPVAVISGVYTRIPRGACCEDSLIEQLPPVNTWGYSFILVPFQNIFSGYVYRVFATNVKTTLSMSDDKIPIEAEDFYEGNVTEDMVVSFTSDQPVMAVQYMKGHDANNPKRGDPSMVIVSPLSSFTNHVTFPVFNYTHLYGHTYHINVITNCSNTDGLILDEITSMANWNRLTTDDQSMCVLRNNVTVGNHKVFHVDEMVTFSVSVYAICDVDCESSYAYQAGVSYVLYQNRPTLMSVTNASFTSERTITTSYSAFLKVSIRTDSEIEISWDSFVSQQTDFQSIRVFYSRGDVFDNTDSSAVFLAGTATGLLITNLKPETTYTVRVEAITSSGLHMTVGEIRVTTMPGILKVMQDQPTEIQIDWEAYQPSEDIDHFRVLYSRGEFLDIDTTEVLLLNGMQRNAVISDLNPSALYTVRVEASTVSGRVFKVGELQVTTGSAPTPTTTTLFVQDGANNQPSSILIGAVVGGIAFVIIVLIITIVIISLIRRRKASSLNIETDDDSDMIVNYVRHPSKGSTNPLVFTNMTRDRMSGVNEGYESPPGQEADQASKMTVDNVRQPSTGRTSNPTDLKYMTNIIRMSDVNGGYEQPSGQETDNALDMRANCVRQPTTSTSKQPVFTNMASARSGRNNEGRKPAPEPAYEELR